MGQRPFIVVGDVTDHGGIVIEGSCLTDTHGKSIARVGDQVTCPKKGHGTTVIVTGDPTMIIDGRAAARHGDKCACGATLIASQVVSTTLDGGSASAPSPLASHGKAAALQANRDAASHDQEEILEQYFELVDTDGAPVEGYKFDLFVEEGLHTRAGYFDGGQTSKVQGDKALRLVMWTSIDGGARHA